MRRGYSDRACGEPDRTRAGRPTRGRRRAEAWRRPREAAPRPWPRAGSPHRQRLPDRPTRSTTGHPATSPSRGRRRDPGTTSRTSRNRHKAEGLRRPPRRRVPPTTRSCAGAAACWNATTRPGATHHLSGRDSDLSESTATRRNGHPFGQLPPNTNAHRPSRPHKLPCWMATKARRRAIVDPWRHGRPRRCESWFRPRSLPRATSIAGTC